MIKLKPIKPKTDPANLKRIERAVRSAMQEAGGRVIDRIEQVGGDWSKPVSGRIVEERNGVRVDVVGPGAQIFQWLDEGTPPHDITPKRARVLRFATGYRARTRPRILGSGGGGSSGGVIFRPRVRHPGTAPRHFIETIQEQAQDELPVIVAQHIGGAVQG